MITKSKNMKKIILLIMVLGCATIRIDAQVHFGIKGGVNFDNFNYKDAKNELTLNNMTGWEAGVVLQFKIPIIGLGVQPELLYTVHKAKLSDVGVGVSDLPVSIRYFEVPLNVQWGVNLGFLRPYVMAGPYFCYAVHFDDYKMKHRMDRFDWGVGAGAGIEIRKIQFGARYMWGLQDVSCRDDFNMRNNSFRLSLTILF